MSTVAVTGLSGEVGVHLLHQMRMLPKNAVDLYHSAPCVGTSELQHTHLNLAQTATIQPTLYQVQPDVIIHLAGITHIDRCESDQVNGQEGEVWQVNVKATEEIARYCAEHQVQLIYLSTECVFDGTADSYQESDPTHPINWYGQTKAAAEKVITESGCNFSIARAVIAYSPTARQTMWQKIVAAMETGTDIKMATDRWMTPTYMGDIALGLDQIIERKQTGFFHLAPTESLTPYQFAVTLAEQMGYSKKLIIPSTLEEIMGPERARLRLVHACLNAERTQQQLGVRFRSLLEILETL